MDRSVLAIIIALLIASAIPALAADSPTYGLITSLKLFPLNLDEKETEELLKMLNDEGVLNRAAAARELGRRKAVDAIQPLTKLLTDQSPVVRLDAADALLELGQMDAMPVLRELLTAVPVSTRLHAAEALARHGDDSGLDFARTQLTSEFSARRERAVEALAASQNEEVAYSALGAGLTDAERLVRLSTIYLLGKRPGKRSVELLGTALSDPDRDIHRAAIRTLAMNGSRDAIPLLINVLAGEDLTACSMAAYALNSLTGQNKRSIVLKSQHARQLETEWRGWWQANKDKPLPGEKK